MQILQSFFKVTLSEATYKLSMYFAICIKRHYRPNAKRIGKKIIFELSLDFCTKSLMRSKGFYLLMHQLFFVRCNVKSMAPIVYKKLMNWVLNWPFFDCESILWVKSLVYALWIFMMIFFFSCTKPSLFKAIEKTNLQGGNVIPTNIIPCQGWLFNIVYFTHNTSRKDISLWPQNRLVKLRPQNN